MGVVSANAGVWAVVSGPGSGKTRCLVERTARLLRSEPIDNILTLTFTAEAAKNLRKRVDALVTVEPSDRVCGAMTFHSLALAFASRERDYFPFELAASPLATEGQAAKIAYGLCTRHKLNYKVFRQWVSLQKRNRTTPAAALRAAEAASKDQQMALAYKEYDRTLQAAGTLDFDSLLVEMVNLLEANQEVHNRWKYRYVSVDESQDCDELQWRLLQLLTEQHGNLMCVGDGNQAIYAFRGACSVHFTEMEKWFPQVQKLYLGTNYRSSVKIVDFVKSIAPVQNELLSHFNTPNEIGVEPVVTQYLTAQQEAEGVVGKIMTGSGTTAVLCRTNFGLRSIEESLLANSVKYHYLGDSGFWGRPEIRGIMNFVQCAVNVTDMSLVSAMRTPFAASQYIKKKEVADAVKEAKKKNPQSTAWGVLSARVEKPVQEFLQFVRGLSALRNLPADQALKEILRRTRAVDYYQEEEAVDSDNNPVANLVELVKAAGKYPDLREFLNFYRRVQLASKQKKGVSLGTIHAAKGLEYENVFLIQAQEGMIPHAKATDLNEEACLLFVAASRAEKNLHISFVGAPSRFLPEIV